MLHVDRSFRVISIFGEKSRRQWWSSWRKLRVHLAKHALVFDVIISNVRFIVGVVLVVHLYIHLGAVVLVLRWKWWYWRNIITHSSRSALGRAVTAAQQADSCGQVLWVLITAVTVGNGSIGSQWTAVAGRAPLAMMGEAVILAWCTFGKR